MEPAGPARVERPARGDPRGRCCRLFAPDRSRRGRHHRPARGAVTSVLIPDANYLRNPEHRELLLSGLRLAAGEETWAKPAVSLRSSPPMWRGIRD